MKNVLLKEYMSRNSLMIRNILFVFSFTLILYSTGTQTANAIWAGDIQLDGGGGGDEAYTNVAVPELFDVPSTFGIDYISTNESLFEASHVQVVQVNKTLWYGYNRWLTNSSATVLPSSDSAVTGWMTGLQNPNITLGYDVSITNTAGTIIPEGSTVAVGQVIKLKFARYVSDNIFWFGTGFSMDSPYGDWSEDAAPPARVGSNVTCEEKDYLAEYTDSLNNSSFGVYVPFMVDPSLRSIVPSSLTGLACGSLVDDDGGKSMTCTVTAASGGSITPKFRFESTFGKFYYRYRDSRTGGKYGSAGCFGNNIASAAIRNTTGPEYEPTDTTIHDPYIVDFQPKEIPVTLYVGSATNTPPQAPTITCPASAVAGDDISVTLAATDPDGNTVRYAMDWISSSAPYSPNSGWTAFVASGVSQTLTKTGGFATPGTYTVHGVAEDSGGLSSSWSACTITVTANTIPTVAWTTTQGGSTYSVTSGGTIPLGAVGYTSTNASYCNHWELDGVTDAGSNFPPAWSLDGALSGAPFTVGSDWGRTTICYAANGTPSAPAYLNVDITPASDLTASNPAAGSFPSNPASVTFTGTAFNAIATTQVGTNFWADVEIDWGAGPGCTAPAAEYSRTAGGPWSGVAAGWSSALSATIPASDLFNGSHCYRMVVDRDNFITETNEANNGGVWRRFSISGIIPQCSDGADNDADGLIDYPADPGCTSLTDNDETNPNPCAADTISFCAVPGANSGESPAGSCVTGYEGSCEYTCTNGAWGSPSNNSCDLIDTSSSNNSPIANAGTNQTITLPDSDAQPSGQSATDADGSVATISWSQTGGPSSATILNGTTINPTFTNLTVVGTYTFVLSVTDNDGATTIDSMTVTVTSVAAPTLTASPAVVLQGGVTTLSWDTNNLDETLCTIQGGSYTNPTTLPTNNGDAETGIVTQTINANTTFTLTCPSVAPVRVTVEILPSGFET